MLFEPPDPQAPVPQAAQVGSIVAQVFLKKQVANTKIVIEM
jgi:hypothetical protein